jgi:hypothetical protein
MCATRSHGDVHRRWEAAPLHLRPDRDSRPRPVDRRCGSMWGCVAMCCTGDCIGSRRQYREHLPATISMTCWSRGGQREKEKAEQSREVIMRFDLGVKRGGLRADEDMVMT